MSEKKNEKFFQNEKKFIVGMYYETLKVNTHQYKTYNVTLETCDEFGIIIPNSEKFLGKYVSSQYFGYGDSGTRCDKFLNDQGVEINHYLDYDGTTRFRQVNRFN